MEQTYQFEDLQSIIETLRGESGCPWDRKQTHESLTNCMVEEAYEVCEAIDRAKQGMGYQNLCEELGDVLFQVVIHSQIAKENGEFTIQDVISGVCEKMIRRHPHVFGEKKEDEDMQQEAQVGTEQIKMQWEEIKKQEKQTQTMEEILNEVPKAFPALIRAQKVIGKSGKEKLVPVEYEEIKKNLLGSLQTLDFTVKNSLWEDMDNALGKMLFSLVNMAWFLQLNAENSLTNATNKFINRLIDVEHLAKAKGIHLREVSESESLFRDHVK